MSATAPACEGCGDPIAAGSDYSVGVIDGDYACAACMPTPAKPEPPARDQRCHQCYESIDTVDDEHRVNDGVYTCETCKDCNDAAASGGAFCSAHGIVDVEPERVESAPVPCKACGWAPDDICPDCAAGTCERPTCAVCRPVKGTEATIAAAWAEVAAEKLAVEATMGAQWAQTKHDGVRNDDRWRRLWSRVVFAVNLGPCPTEKR